MCDFRVETVLNYKCGRNNDYLMLCIAKDFESFLYIVEKDTMNLYIPCAKTNEYKPVKLVGHYITKNGDDQWFGIKDYTIEDKDIDCYDDIMKWWATNGKNIITNLQL